jgi:subtilisin family serine protease
MLRSVLLGVLLLAVAVAFSAPLAANTTTPANTLAPLIIPAAAQKIPKHYIVVFKPATQEKEMRQTTDRVVNKLGGKIVHEYRAALNGFSAKLSKKAVKQLRKNPRVEFVEQDTVITLDDSVRGQTPRPMFDIDQNGATWGLDRIDQRNMPLNGIYSYTATGSGVRAYIIDTGIRITHAEFGGRAQSGYTAISDGNGTNDCNGHGTHVAGTVGGTTYGVAKNVTLYAVRVLGCNGSGSNSGVIAGVDWVTANRVLPAVANMSLGGSVSTALDTAVNNSINAGVSYAIAAGNSNANACNYSPARAAAAITVGSTTNTDARSSFSNFGTCLDIFAPGSNITSAWITNDTSTNTISGTSMAAPHVAGVAALYLQNNTGASASAVRNAIVNNATANKVTSPGTGSPNLLLYSIFGGTPPTATPTNPPGPTATPVPPTATPPPGGAELITNGGFEGGASPWVLSGNSYHSTGGYPRSGTGYTVHGAYNFASGTMYQQVSIPSSAPTANLTLWLNVTSSETTTTVKYDYLYVEVRNTSGALLQTLATYSNLDKGTIGAYSQKGAFNLSAYKGQTVRVQFRATTDSSLATSFRVDDVSLK